MSLFEKKNFISHAGKELDFKIECDNLTDEDLEALAYVVSKKILFSKVIGIPTGGLRFAKALEKYKKGRAGLLIVDDVLTTGSSMEEEKNKQGRLYTMGVVIFARGQYPDWIFPIFTFSNYYD